MKQQKSLKKSTIQRNPWIWSNFIRSRVPQPIWIPDSQKWDLGQSHLLNSTLMKWNPKWVHTKVQILTIVLLKKSWNQDQSKQFSLGSKQIFKESRKSRWTAWDSPWGMDRRGWEEQSQTHAGQEEEEAAAAAEVERLTAAKPSMECQ